MFSSRWETGFWFHFSISEFWVFLASFVKEAVFFQKCVFFIFVKKLHDYSCVGLTLDPLFYSIDLYVCFCAMLFYYYDSVV